MFPYINLTWYSYILIYIEIMKIFMDIMAVHFDSYTKHVKCTSITYNNVKTLRAQRYFSAAELKTVQA